MAEENLKIVDLAALLHDIDDYKYETEDGPTVRALHFLESQNVPSETIARVMAIIDNLGFKEELGGQPVGELKLGRSVFRPDHTEAFANTC